MIVTNPYNSKLLKYSKEHRRNPTPAEQLLWKHLRRNQMFKYKFRRQHPLLNYIVDFYCIKLKLAIEIDGMSHNDDKYNYDQKRENDLKQIGIEFLRFTEFEVKNNIQNVLSTIENFITE